MSTLKKAFISLAKGQKLIKCADCKCKMVVGKRVRNCLVCDSANVLEVKG